VKIDASCRRKSLDNLIGRVVTGAEQHVAFDFHFSGSEGGHSVLSGIQARSVEIEIAIDYRLLEP
jgi:hypothetical protein